MGTHGIEAVVILDAQIAIELVEEREPFSRSLRHRDGDGVVQCDHRVVRVEGLLDRQRRHQTLVRHRPRGRRASRASAKTARATAPVTALLVASTDGSRVQGRRP
jgi:hypothetical protein